MDKLTNKEWIEFNSMFGQTDWWEEGMADSLCTLIDRSSVMTSCATAQCNFDTTYYGDIIYLLDKVKIISIHRRLREEKEAIQKMISQGDF